MDEPYRVAESVKIMGEGGFKLRIFVFKLLFVPFNSIISLLNF